LNTPGPPCMYCQSVSCRCCAGLCGATSPETSAAQTSPPCTVAAVQPGRVVPRLLMVRRLEADQCAKLRPVGMGELQDDSPPIEQPMTTGRSRAIALQNARTVCT